MVSFKEILDRVRMVSGYTQKRIASELFGISTENLSNKIRRNSIDINVLVIWAKSRGVDLNWLLTGKGEPYLSTKATEKTAIKDAEISPDYSPNHSDISDAEIIQQFTDKKYAKELNSSLAELEQLNPDAFKKLGSYIKGLLDGLRMTRPGSQHVGPDRRVAQRRVKDNPKKYKGAKDKRSGKDRRVAAQR